MSDLFELPLKVLAFTLGLVLVLVLAASPFFGIAAWLDSSACSARADVMGINHKWGLAIGCMVEIRPGHWVSLDAVTSVDLLGR